MVTPIRLVLLECPRCQATELIFHTDHTGRPGGDNCLEIGDRPGGFCSQCGREAGLRVKEQAPPELFLQPHDLYPMTVAEFAHWFSILRTHFPTDERLATVGVFWYPGKRRCLHEGRLSRACSIGQAQHYHLSLSNRSPDDKRVRVCIQRAGAEAHFWIDPAVELHRCYYGFDEHELKVIGDLLATKEPEIRAAWQRFSTYARQSRARWLAKLQAPPW